MADSALVGILRVLLTANTAEFDTALTNAQKTAMRFQKDLDNWGRQATRVGTTLTAAITLPLVGIGAASVKVAADFQSAMANVAKTTGETGQPLEDLRQGIRDLAKEIPATAEELANIAAIGGQFGIATEDLLGFTEHVTNLGVAVDGISAEQAAMGLAQFGGVMRESDKDIGKLASTLVKLGNEGRSTEEAILEFSKRLSGAGQTIGLTSAEVMGIGAAMANLGINAEAGGSAMSRVMARMEVAVEMGGEKLQGFAEVAGMTAAAFAESFENRPVEAIMAFLDGLSRTKDGTESLTMVLADLNITGLRELDSLKRLAGAQGEVAKQVAFANEAYKDGNFHTREAAIKYETFWNQVKLLGNQLRDVGITLGDALLPMLRGMITAARPVVEVIAALAEGFKAMPVAVQVATAAVLGLLAALGPAIFIFGQLASGLSSIVGLFGAKGLAVKAFNMQLPTYLQNLTTAKTATEAWTLATRGLWTAMMGPAGIVVAIAAVGVAWATAKDDWTRFFDVVIPPLGLLRTALDEIDKQGGLLKRTMEDLKTIAGSLGSSISNDLSRRLDIAKKELREIGTGILELHRGALKTFTGWLGIEFPGAAKTLTDNLNKIHNFLKEGPAFWKRWKDDAAAQMLGLSNFVHAEAEKIRESRWLPNTANFAAALVPLKEGIKDTSNEVRKLTSDWDANTEAKRRNEERSKELKKIQDEMFGRDLIEKANDMVAALGGIENISKLNEEQQKRLNQAVVAALDAYKRLSLEAPAALEKVAEKTTPLLRSTIDVARGWEEMAGSIEDSGAQVRAIAQGFDESGDLISLSFEETTERIEENRKSLQEWIAKGGAFPATVQSMSAEIQELTKNVGIFDGILDDLGDTIVSAFQGGGDVLRSIGATIGKRLGENVVKHFGDTFTGVLGSVVGSFIPVIGSLLGPLLGKIGELFGGISPEIKQARTDVAAFQVELNKTATAAQIAEANLTGWADKGALTVIQVRAAFQAIGRTAEEADKLVRQLWDTDRPERARAAMEEITLVMEEYKKKVAEAVAEEERLTAELETYQTELDTLRGEGEITWEKMKEAADRYGVRLEALGPAFQRSRLHESAQQIFDDFVLLTRGGADVGGVLLDMKDEIIRLALEAKQFGVQIPLNFKPLIDNLILSDQLTEDERQALKSLGEENFGDPVVAKLDQIATRMGELITKIDEIVARLAQNLVGAADHAQRAIGGIGSAGRVAADDIDRSFRGTAIPALEDTAEAIENVIEMRSPTGLIGIAYYAKLASDSIKGLSQAGVADMRSLQSSVGNVAAEFLKMNVDLGKMDPVALAREHARSAGSAMFGVAKDGFFDIRNLMPVNMASGGVVTQPTLAMVGEAGAEAVIPLGEAAIGNEDLLKRLDRLTDRFDRFAREQSRVLTIAFRDALLLSGSSA